MTATTNIPPNTILDAFFMIFFSRFICDAFWPNYTTRLLALWTDLKHGSAPALARRAGTTPLSRAVEVAELVEN
jgi:hypothetical protein